VDGQFSDQKVVIKMLALLGETGAASEQQLNFNPSLSFIK
jgi:hypothetical protein